jgi:hypothetical protein
VSESATACYNAAMHETWGERIARIIALEEGLVAIDGFEERLASYLKEPELRGRFMQDAAKLAKRPVGSLTDAWATLLPADCEVSCHTRGFEIRAAAWANDIGAH